MKLENSMIEKKTIIESKDEERKKPTTPASPKTTLKQCSSLCSSSLRKNSASMTVSNSSDASSSCESSPLSVASSSSCKNVMRRSGVSSTRKLSVGKEEDKVAGVCFPDGRKRCAWITSKADPCYVAFHDEEWGVPVHDDKKLFELLLSLVL